MSADASNRLHTLTLRSELEERGMELKELEAIASREMTKGMACMDGHSDLQIQSVV